MFATGTPISNTMCELYVMQLYLQKQKLEEMGIYHFDSWAANFGEVTTALELTVEGSGFRFKSRFNKFTNLPELMNIFREVADVQTKDMLDPPVPKLRNGRYVIVESEPDWYVKQVMENFVARAERIRGGGVDPSDDNFLKITHEARLLGTDSRLLEPDAPASPDSKLNKVVSNVLAEYEKAAEEGKTGCQLVFSDIGTPKSSWNQQMTEDGYWESIYTFDVYNYIKTELVKRGMDTNGCSMKVYVDVLAGLTTEEDLIHQRLTRTDGIKYDKQKVADMRRAVSLKARGIGLRDTRIIEGKQGHLYYEDNNLYIAGRV